MVFIELVRRGCSLSKKELFYYRTSAGKEIDFVVKKGSSVNELIQVSYDISKPKTRQRELDALVVAADEIKCENLTLIPYFSQHSVASAISGIVEEWYSGSFLPARRCAT